MIFGDKGTPFEMEGGKITEENHYTLFHHEQLIIDYNESHLRQSTVWQFVNGVGDVSIAVLD